MNFFNNVAVFTDLHLGAKSNSRQHNEDCYNFVKWFCEEAKRRECDVCIFGGDYHHNRSSVNVITLNYSVKCITELSNTFENVYILVGNHDLFYREKRSLNSFPYADLHDNVHVVNHIIEKNDVALVPWLVHNEWKKIKGLKSRYIFGHFELPHFLMNAAVAMPNTNTLQVEDFENHEYVFSGHFHKRQIQDNIHYMGSPFGHTYADAWDFKRGAMFMEWNGKPEYVDYVGPRYVTCNITDLIDNPEKYLNNNTFCRTILDVDITYEEAKFVKETFAADYSPRELALLPKKKIDYSIDPLNNENIIVETVDQIVHDQIIAIDSKSFNNYELLRIYNDLTI